MLLGGHVGLRDIRKALAALARELNDSEAKRLQIEDALRSAGGGVGISEVGAYKPMYGEGTRVVLLSVLSVSQCLGGMLYRPFAPEIFSPEYALHFTTQIDTSLLRRECSRSVR